MRAARTLLVVLALLAWPAWAKGSYAEREEVQEFIRSLALKHGFAEQDLRYLFSRVRRAEPVLEAIKPPPPKARRTREKR